MPKPQVQQQQHGMPPEASNPAPRLSSLDTRPSVSVVIPTYNHADFVLQAIESVLAQTFRDFEVIVIDDGSTDNTRQLIAPYMGAVHYYYQENRGLSSARNAGIRSARGQWIALLDSDDLWHPQKLERQLTVAALLSDASLIGNETLDFSSGLPTMDVKFSGIPPSRYVSLRDLVYGSMFGSGSGAMIHRSCFEKVGMFDESLRAVEDLECWLRIADRFRIAQVLEPLTYIRKRPNSMSSQAASMELNHRRVIDQSFSTLAQLQHKRLWKHVALARMYRGVAVMHFEAGNRVAGLRSLWRSFLAFPLTSGVAPPLIRTRLAVHHLFF